MPNPRKHIIYPTDPDEQERLSRHISRHKYSDKQLSLPCANCTQTTPHAVAKLIERGELRYAVRCSNCQAIATITGNDSAESR